MARSSIYKSPEQLRAMLRPGRITAAALAEVRAAIRPGVTTLELDGIAERSIRGSGAEPNFMLVPGYSHTICASVNQVVVHGIPDARPLEPGDIVSVDCGAQFEGWNGDSAITVVVTTGTAPDMESRRSAARRRLSDATESALWAGIASLATARHLGQVGEAIEDRVQALGEFGIVEDYTGHGIGRNMHEDPPVFNYRTRGRGAAVKAGLVVAIEPMITSGGIDTFTGEDQWSVFTADDSDAAHWEHSVAVHAEGLWVLTAEDGGAAGLAPYGVVPVAIP